MDPASEAQTTAAIRFEEPSLPDWWQVRDYIQKQWRFLSGIVLSVLIHSIVLGIAPHRTKPAPQSTQAITVRLETQKQPSAKQQAKQAIITNPHSNFALPSNNTQHQTSPKVNRHLPPVKKQSPSATFTANITQTPPAVMAWWQYQSEDMGYYVAEDLDQLASPSNGAGFLQPVLGSTPDQPGHVLVRIYINEHGGVDRVEILDSTPPGVFEQAVMLELYKSSFTPALKQGLPVKSQKDIDIRFDVLINQRMLDMSGEKPELFDPR